MHPRRKSWRSKTARPLGFYVLNFLLCEVLFLSVPSIWQQCLASSSSSMDASLPSSSTIPSRVYPVKKFQCLQETKKRAVSGMVFKKLEWTEGDTVSSVILKITQRCRDNSFLVTFVRDPTQRAIEEFFHQHVSREKWDPTDTNFQHLLLTPPTKNENMYLRKLAMEPFTPGKGTTEQVVMDILHRYDFIGVTERLDESLVVMKMLLGLETRDILYVPNPGPFIPWYFNVSATVCTYHGIAPFISTTMSLFFASPAWQTKIAGDTMLFHAATTSLDRTIATLGKGRVQNELVQFHHAMDELAQKKCYRDIVFPCTSSGRLVSQHDCMEKNLGCGFDCLDQKSSPG